MGKNSATKKKIEKIPRNATFLVSSLFVTSSMLGVPEDVFKAVCSCNLTHLEKHGRSRAWETREVFFQEIRGGCGESPCGCGIGSITVIVLYSSIYGESLSTMHVNVVLMGVLLYQSKDYDTC